MGSATVGAGSSVVVVTEGTVGEVRRKGTLRFGTTEASFDEGIPQPASVSAIAARASSERDLTTAASPGRAGA